MAAATDASEEHEVLLPEVVADVVSGRPEDSPDGGRIRVLHTDGRCMGVTHPDDLALVQAIWPGRWPRASGPPPPSRPSVHEQVTSATMTRTSRLVVALALNVALVVGQVVAGVAANSAGLLSDAGHNLTDVAAVVLSLLAVRWALAPAQRRPHVRQLTGAPSWPRWPTRRCWPWSPSPSWSRASSGWCTRSTWTPAWCVVAAPVAMVVNAVAALVLHEHGHDLNMRTAMVHMAADVASSARAWPWPPW